MFRTTAHIYDLIYQLCRAVGAMAEHLSSGGVLIVDGWVRPDAWIDGGHTRIEVAEDEGCKVVRVSRSSRVGNKTYLEMHHLVAGPDGIDHFVDEHTLTLFTDEEYRAAFTGAGLEVDVTPSPMAGRDRYIAGR